MSQPANPVHWFEIPVLDMDRAKAFYESVFEIELQVTQMATSLMAFFPMIQGSPGSPGSLTKEEGYTPSYDGSVVYFLVDDINAALGRADEKGGKTLVPKMSIGEHGFIAHLADTEGNRIALYAMT